MHSELTHIVHGECRLITVFTRLDDLEGHEFSGLNDVAVAGRTANQLVEMCNRIDRIGVGLLPSFLGDDRPPVVPVCHASEYRLKMHWWQRLVVVASRFETESDLDPRLSEVNRERYAQLLCLRF